MSNTKQNFTSLNEFIDHTMNSKPPEKRLSSLSSENGRKAWTGSESLEESLRIANEGYELDKIDTQLKSLGTNEGYELRQVLAVSGGVVDVGLYLEGQPECMYDFEIMESNKFVHIIMGVGESSGISSEQIINRAVSVCSIVDKLESDKYRVKLSLSVKINDFGKKGSDLTIVDIKDYKDRMSLAQLAGVLHTGFFRRVFFRYMEGHKDFDSWDGYGHPDSDVGVIESIKESGFISDSFVFLPSISEKTGGADSPTLAAKFRNLESAKEYSEDVQKRISELTVHV